MIEEIFITKSPTTFLDLEVSDTVRKKVVLFCKIHVNYCLDLRFFSHLKCVFSSYKSEIYVYQLVYI